MGKFVDLTGQKFGRLTVVYRAENRVSSSGVQKVYWHCKCSCGKEIDVCGRDLKSKHTQSCGCLQKDRVFECNSKHNAYAIKDNYIIAITSNNIEFLIDAEDKWVLENYCWSTNCDNYLVSKSRNEDKYVLLHRIILNCNDKRVVDHINGNTLDNRKSNLRIVTRTQNNMNKCIQSNNTSGVTGVYFENKSGRWYSQITVNDKTYNLGCFDNFEDAVAARKAAEEKYFGEYSYDNSRNKPSQNQEVT